MVSRRFFSNQENHGFNLTGGERTMAIAHSKTFVSQPSHDERAYEGYKRMCAAFGTTPLQFDIWLKTSEKIDRDRGAGAYSAPMSLSAHGGAIARNQQAFHQRDMAYDNFRGLKEPPQRAWSGSWDNAVRAIEG